MKSEFTVIRVSKILLRPEKICFIIISIISCRARSKRTHCISHRVSMLFGTLLIGNSLTQASFKVVDHVLQMSFCSSAVP